MLHTSRIPLSIIIVIGYVLLSSWSLIHMGHMAAHGSSMEDCPYLALQHNDDGTLYGHLSVWQSFMLVALPLIFLFGWVGAPLHITLSASTWLPRWQPSFEARLVKPPIALLFANGILHPKAP